MRRWLNIFTFLCFSCLLSWEARSSYTEHGTVVEEFNHFSLGQEYTVFSFDPGPNDPVEAYYNPADGIRDSLKKIGAAMQPAVEQWCSATSVECGEVGFVHTVNLHPPLEFTPTVVTLGFDRDPGHKRMNQLIDAILAALVAEFPYPEAPFRFSVQASKEPINGLFFAPGTPVYRYNTTSTHLGTLARIQSVGAISFAAGPITLHPSGKPSHGTLATPMVLNTIALPAGTELIFGPTGEVLEVKRVPEGKIAIGGIAFDTFMGPLTFYSDGTPRMGFLSEETTIQEMVLGPRSYVAFYDNGMLWNVRPTAATTYRSREIPANHVISFDRSGAIIEESGRLRRWWVRVARARSA